MRHPARLLAWLPLTCVLVACGDAPPSGSGAGLGAPPAPPGPPADASALRNALQDAMARRGKAGGADALPAALRPLTAADVETYLKIHPEVRKVAGDVAAVTKLLEAHGLTTPQWAVLQGRVVGVAMGLKHGQLPPTLEGDVAVVTPFQERILRSVEGR